MLQTQELVTEHDGATRPSRKECVYCCGIEILYSFGYLGYSDYNKTDPTQADIEKFIAQCNVGCTKKGLLLATTSTLQPVAIAALKACGFQPLVNEFFNPNSDQKVTLWGKLINQARIGTIEAIEDGNV